MWNSILCNATLSNKQEYYFNIFYKEKLSAVMDKNTK